MPTSAIEQRLVDAFAGLNPELKRMLLPAFDADLAAWRRARATERLRLVKPLPAASTSSSIVADLVDRLQQLAALAPHEFHDLRHEIDRRLVIVQRAQAAHIDAVSQPWPWSLYHAVRNAPGVSAAARILRTVLDATPDDRPDIVTFARAIRAADQRAARIILNLLLEEYVPLSTAARFEREG